MTIINEIILLLTVINLASSRVWFAATTIKNNATEPTTQKPTSEAGPKSEANDTRFGGKEVKEGQFPYMMYVEVPMITPKTKQMVPCVGVIISSVHVLFEAACAAALRVQTDKVFSLENGKAPEPSTKSFPISKIQIHPAFDFRVIGNKSKVPIGANLAVITLSEDLASNSTVLLSDKPIVKPTNTTVVSFGIDNDFNYSQNLHRYEVEMLDSETCKKNQSSEYTNLTEKGFLCSRAQKTSLPMSMEGPAIITDDSPEKHSLIGIYTTRLRDKPKPGMIYGVWTSVADYIEWIREIIKK